MAIYWNDGAFLYHYGVQGQKWGDRRYQNLDGSLTEEGRKHYGYGDARKAGNTIKKVAKIYSRATRETIERMKDGPGKSQPPKNSKSGPKTRMPSGPVIENARGGFREIRTHEKITDRVDNKPKGYTQIKPKSNMTIADANDFWKNMRENPNTVSRGNSGTEKYTPEQRKRDEAVYGKSGANRIAKMVANGVPISGARSKEAARINSARKTAKNVGKVTSGIGAVGGAVGGWFASNAVTKMMSLPANSDTIVRSSTSLAVSSVGKTLGKIGGESITMLLYGYNPNKLR